MGHYVPGLRSHFLSVFISARTGWNKSDQSALELVCWGSGKSRKPATAPTFHGLRQHSHHTKEIQEHASEKCTRVDAHPSVESVRDPAKLAVWAAAVAAPCSATDSQDLLFPCPQHKQVRLQGLFSCWISNSHFYPPDFLREKTNKIRSGCGPTLCFSRRTRN